MLYKEVEEYAEALLFARKAIADAVRNKRAQQKAERLDFLFRDGRFDPTANKVIKDMTPIAVVSCCHLGQTFLVYRPEDWLDTMKKAFVLFRQRFSGKAYRTIQHRYLWEWSVTKCVVTEGIAKRTYQTRRTEFLHGYVMLAIQAGLVEIDASVDTLKKLNRE